MRFNLIAFFYLLMSVTSYASADDGLMERITSNVERVCDKPENAGEYWDVKVKGGGDASVRLKLANLGVTGEVEFQKGEWEGVKKTVEDSKSYRECTQLLAPIFIEKFTIDVPTENKNSKSKRTLGGIQWQVFGGGVSFTLESCDKKSTSVNCTFTAEATDNDVAIEIEGGSAIYDQNGNKFMSSYASISNFTGSLKRRSDEVKGELIRGVKTKVTIRFSNIKDDSESISKAMVVALVIGPSSNTRQNFDFRDVDIKID